MKAYVSFIIFKDAKQYHVLQVTDHANVFKKHIESESAASPSTGRGTHLGQGAKGDARVSMFISHIAQKVQEYTFIFNLYAEITF